MIEWGTYPEEMEMAAFCRGTQVVILEEDKIKIQLNSLPLNTEQRVAYIIRCQNDGCEGCRKSSRSKGYWCTGLNRNGEATVSKNNNFPSGKTLYEVMKDDQSPCVYAVRVTAHPVIDAKFK